MNRSQAFSLGSSIEPDSIYVDFAVTKSELARLLDPTFRTQKWHTEKAVSKSRILVKIETIII